MSMFFLFCFVLFFFVAAVLMGMKWYIIVILTCDYCCWTCFDMLIGYIYILFAEMTINILCQFLIFFIVELYKFFMYSRYYSLTRYMLCKYFLTFHEFSFNPVDTVLWGTKILNFGIVQFTYFFLLLPVLSVHSQEIITTLNVMKISS